MSWLSRRGLFVEGKWSYFDDLMVFTLFFGGVVNYALAIKFLYNVSEAIIFSCLGGVLWLLMTLYIADLQKK